MIKSSMLPTPRHFQQAVLSKLENTDCDRILVSAPTGAGKSILEMYIAEKALAAGNKVILLVDRITLISQLSDTANSYGLSHNVIQGTNRKQNGHKFTIGSIQTIMSDFSQLKEYDLVLIDEAHTRYSNLDKYLNDTHKGLVIGATATAWTQGTGLVYKEYIQAVTAHKLTQLGILCRLAPYTFAKIDMAGAKTIGGEWTSKEVQTRSVDILGDVVNNYIMCAYGKRSIAFCANLAHCEDVANQFTARNIPVAIFTSKTSNSDRKKILDDFDAKKIWVLISIDCLAKGFDRLYIECILDLRPLRRSLATYVQMVGRGLRSMPGKSCCMLLDFSGNMQRFLDDYESVYFNGITSLDCTPKLERIRHDDKHADTAIKCPGCGFSHFHSQCIKCGYKLQSTSKRPVTVDINAVRLPVKLKNKPPRVPPRLKQRWKSMKAIFKQLLNG